MYFGIPLARTPSRMKPQYLAIDHKSGICLSHNYLYIPEYIMPIPIVSHSPSSR